MSVLVKEGLNNDPLILSRQAICIRLRKTSQEPASRHDQMTDRLETEINRAHQKQMALTRFVKLFR